MIINQEGLRYTYNGMTYTVGAAVMATEASEYRGLYTYLQDCAHRQLLQPLLQPKHPPQLGTEQPSAVPPSKLTLLQ